MCNKRYRIAAFALAVLLAAVTSAPAQAAPCMIITLTGTQAGPPVSPGVAGAGTLVRYGDDANNCSAVKLQFDAGRGTTMRLAQIGVSVEELNAIFFTHMHSDHTDGFADIMQVRWTYWSHGPKIDMVCSSDVVTLLGFSVSCAKFAMHVSDSYLQSGEIAQRIEDVPSRLLGGPAKLIHLMTFALKDEPHVVWSAGDVKVSAIRSFHSAGHASYRVDTPVGSVVIGGDASNDKTSPPRLTSTSDQIEKLARDVDLIVHSTMHPVMGKPESGMPPALFYRQALASDLGAMAKRVGAKYLMLTHLSPPLGVDHFGTMRVPGGPLKEADFKNAVQESGFAGTVVVGTDLASVKIPAN